MLFLKMLADSFLSFLVFDFPVNEEGEGSAQKNDSGDNEYF